MRAELDSYPLTLDNGDDEDEDEDEDEEEDEEEEDEEEEEEPLWTRPGHSRAWLDESA